MARLKGGPQPEFSKTMPVALLEETMNDFLSQRLKNETRYGKEENFQDCRR